MNTHTLRQKFKEVYGRDAESLYFAPGRVNLIGEHIDYNGGRVFPCALSFGTYLLAAKRQDSRMAFTSLNMPYSTVKGKDALERKSGEWTDYPLGVVKEFADRGFEPWGYDLLYWGDIPNRAGLSSSASVEVVTAVLLNDLSGAGFDRIELVKMSQHAENDFVGMNCGIMDQFAVGMGRSGFAIALDCATLDYELVPLHIDGYKLVIANSNKHHDLVTSEYNMRRAQCEKALEILRQRYPVDALCALTPEQLEKAADLFSDEILYCLGRLMNESHHSLKEDYEVTGVEMDVLAEEAQGLDGVLGSRITGGGFGGCTVSLVREDAVDAFVRRLGEIYTGKVGLRAEFYVADIGDGARKIC